MTDVSIVPFDPNKASRAEWARFHRFRRQRHKEREPEDPIRSDASVEASLRQPETQWEESRFAAIRAGDEGEQVGALWFEVVKEASPDYEENKHMAWTYIEVLADSRHQRIGSQLLSNAVQLAKEKGRSLLIFWTNEDDGKGYLEAIGAEVAQRIRESRLSLDQVDWEMVKEWAEEGPKRSPRTTLRFFDNYIPDEILDDFTESLTEAFNQMPRDNLQRGDWAITPQTIRQHEAEFKEVGAHRLSAVTIEPDGRISGLTEMGYFPEEDWLIRQYMTGVRLVYRGRGIGKWLKAAMLLHLREEFPRVGVVSTGNATTNAAMLGINVRLGFRPYKDALLAQIQVRAAEERLRKMGL